MLSSFFSLRKDRQIKHFIKKVTLCDSSIAKYIKKWCQLLNGTFFNILLYRIKFLVGIYFVFFFFLSFWIFVNAHWKGKDKILIVSSIILFWIVLKVEKVHSLKRFWLKKTIKKNIFYHYFRSFNFWKAEFS